MHYLLVNELLPINSSFGCSGNINLSSVPCRHLCLCLDQTSECSLRKILSGRMFLCALQSTLARMLCLPFCWSNTLIRGPWWMPISHPMHQRSHFRTSLHKPLVLLLLNSCRVHLVHPQSGQRWDPTPRCLHLHLMQQGTYGSSGISACGFLVYKVDSFSHWVIWEPSNLFFSICDTHSLSLNNSSNCCCTCLLHVIWCIGRTHDYDFLCHRLL